MAAKIKLENVREIEQIELSSEEIDLLDDKALDAIEDWNDREFDQYLKELDEAIGYTGPVRG